MNVVFTEHAVARLRQIAVHIAVDLPEHAVAVSDRIFAHVEMLGERPQSGQPLPQYGGNVREVSEAPYRIIYAVRGEVVHVLTVMHERELLPDEIPIPGDG